MTFAVRLLLILFLSTIPLAVTHAQEVAPPDEVETVKPILPPEGDNSVVETSDPLEKLFEKLKKDPKASSAGATARMIWREWSFSGSKSIDLLMNWAIVAMGREEYAKAEDLLDQVVVLAPDYAEGWNRRATLYYTMDDFSRSLADIETTLALEPRHFGALSGLAVIMQRVGNDKAALKAWYKVLEIYPANPQAQQSVITLEEKLAGSRT
ncbi:MAG: tetratricopeptide repeat protein [Pseudomonadota bacterium]